MAGIRNKIFGCIALLSAVTLVPSVAIGQTTKQDCFMQMNFDVGQMETDWRAVNDGVMGGRSSGGPSFDDGRMVFEGVINTNGGGFSSVRAPVQRGALSAANGFKFRVKSDGRAYKLTMRTDARKGWREVSFQAGIPKTPIGEWAEVMVPFDALEASVFGRQVRAIFDRDTVQTIGIILADGIDGPFRLEVEWIKACGV